MSSPHASNASISQAGHPESPTFYGRNSRLRRHATQVASSSSAATAPPQDVDPSEPPKRVNYHRRPNSPGFDGRKSPQSPQRRRRASDVSTPAPYPCPYCEKAYMSRQGLNVHMKKRHGDVNRRSSAPYEDGSRTRRRRPQEPVSSASMVDEDDEMEPTSSSHGRRSPAGAPMQSCPHCDLKSKDRPFFAAHLQFHTIGNPFRCADCGVQCADKWAFYRHIAYGEEHRI